MTATIVRWSVVVVFGGALVLSAQNSNNNSGDWEARAIAGYHQTGAASADHQQNFFFDFFVMRALHKYPLWGGEDSKGKSVGSWNLWGDVRIASAPQQVTTGVATFATEFSTQIGNLPVNQLAESADFQSGLEYRLHTWERTDSYRMLGAVGFFGASGAFEAPSKQVTIYEVPTTDSSQYARFAATYPIAAKYKYVGFVPADRDRFYREYGVGFRVTTFPKDQPLAPPSMYTFTVGQDESVTGGIMRSVVGRFDVFYPLPLSGMMGNYKCIYLFGTASLRLGRAQNADPFVLKDPNRDASGQPLSTPAVVASDPTVAITTVRNTRDTYRIGVGVDLVNLIQSLCKSAGKCM